MAESIKKTTWDPEESDLTKAVMNKRIKDLTSYLNWQHAIKLLDGTGIPFDKLKIAEVGCGTGTFSLSLGLLGASVTLVDFNQKVLERTRRAFGLYDCKADFIKADCLEPPPGEIAGTFDFVVSMGLAEHFIGQNRKRCIDYHRVLLKKGGVAFISVPNKLSAFYQGIVLFCKVTGSWGIDVEVPFSAAEFRKLAREAGFSDFYVVGNAPLSRDLRDYSRGFISAMVDILPARLKERIRNWKREITQGNSSSEIQEDIVKHCRNMVESIRQKAHDEQDTHNGPQRFLTDRFSAGLTLAAFK